MGQRHRCFKPFLNWTSCLRFLLLIVICWVTPSLANTRLLGQSNELRYELGKRLQRFEKAWESASTGARTASTPMMEQAVQSFFGLDLIKAARKLDEAWLTLQYHPSDIPDDSKFLASLSLRLEYRWIDATAQTIPAKIESLYETTNREPVDNSRLDSISVTCRLVPFGFPFTTTASVNSSLPGEQQLQLRSARESFELKIPGIDTNTVPTGDYLIEFQLSDKTTSFPGIGNQISIVHDLGDQTKQIENWISEQKSEPKQSPKNHAMRTAKFLARGLLDAQQQKKYECDIPLAQWLTRFSQLTKRVATNDATDPLKNILNIEATGNHWLALSGPTGEQIVRIDIPHSVPRDRATRLKETNEPQQIEQTPAPEQPSVSSKRIPVLFAFHGAGGSENMFFETYGAGKLIALARERGWIVISPRQGLLGLSMNLEQMTDALAEYLPIDTEQIYVVGHSMGAGAAMGQVAACPTKIRAVAAIGGGGRVPTSAASKKIHYFVAAGSRDFGRGQAFALSGGLKEQHCDTIYREYKDIEHMVIVQAALDDVFKFFDSHAVTAASN